MFNATRLPGYLADRYRGWKATKFDPDRAWFARLAQDGQRPRAMLLSCCDSRVDAVSMFGAEPGDLFVVRNVANLVPPYNPDHEHHGTSAAIEYAVTSLRVAHIIVLGHAHCGGVAACHDMCAGDAPELDESSSFVGRWMDILRPTYEKHAKSLPSEREDRLRAFEKQAVLASIDNLSSFPFVAEAIENGTLTLHGAWIDIADGTLHVYDADAGEFSPV